MRRTFFFASVSASALGLFLACSSTSRRPASEAFQPPELLPNLVASSETVLSQVRSPDFNSASCPAYVRALVAKVEAIQPAKLGRGSLTSIAKPMVDRLWDIRVALHDRLPEFDAACVAETRNLTRQLRFVEDYFAEMAASIAGIGPSDIADFQNEKIPVKESAPAYLLQWHPKYASLATTDFFAPGDLMVTRGVSFLSATISRIGDIQSQFSHVVFVNRGEAKKDGSPGAAETIESYVSTGVGVYDMDYALKNENARILYLRPKDGELGAKAAAYMSDRVKRAIAAKKPIPYDFELNFDEHSRLSCAEVSRDAYEEASNKAMIIPEFPSTVSSNAEFLRRVGMSRGRTFTPGDLEVDSRFDLVFEWRDLRLTRDERQKDAILTSMIRWIDEDGYSLRHSFKSRLAGSVIYEARKTFLWPLAKKLTGAPQFPKDMPPTQLETMTLLNQIGEKILAELRARDAAFERANGVPMTYVDLYASLEELRARDLADYMAKKTRSRSIFHRWLRPDLEHAKEREAEKKAAALRRAPKKEVFSAMEEE